MQVMEGDVIRTIQQNHQHIAHYHTGGVPGRHVPGSVNTVVSLGATVTVVSL